MTKRFRKLRGIIGTSIVDNDCFNLTGMKAMAMSPAQPGQFDFPTSEGKISAFMEWLQGQEDDGILEIVSREGRRVVGRGAWTDKYIQLAYDSGIQQAKDNLEKVGYDVSKGVLETGFYSPRHADRLGLLYTRCFNDLKGITDAMDGQVSRVLAEGIAKGQNPRKLAKMLNRTISGPSGDLGITDILGRYIPAERRAKMLARTEIIRAHHQAQVNEYREAGIADVKVIAEWMTAGYDVCPICADMEGRTYNLDQIEGMIPAHPNCRCTIVPHIKD